MTGLNLNPSSSAAIFCFLATYPFSSSLPPLIHLTYWTLYVNVADAAINFAINSIHSTSAASVTPDKFTIILFKRDIEFFYLRKIPPLNQSDWQVQLVSTRLVINHPCLCLHPSKKKRLYNHVFKQLWMPATEVIPSVHLRADLESNWRLSLAGSCAILN
jgi:hypothetical protein